MQKKQTRLAGIILAICCILAVIVFFQTRPDTTVGEKKITISVIHSDSSKSTFSYDTDAISGRSIDRARSCRGY